MAGVAYYNIAGRQVGGHYLAMGILGGLFAGIYGATSGPKRPAAANNTPPINASSSDEADFIKKFLEEQEGSEKKQ
ncbi:ATP synthase subunit K-like protein [Hapsidospora chrysogenum ATCC 11550]|uniref:ATP synthase subunit K-like protein n=1 Tax=Hapsidospora chrysogenum (strain ATCC 11550 / CBS 779.69 / DSM 880 / IAM 14645 / JCM 23072 / IMI 49137) TaxID=857340 RepID=A0A086T712_HAPC1|nr:ATP synthase subunit K-like protein [Hapsidospora chrysogenum ATCC 11550]